VVAVVHKHCFLGDGFYAEWLANIEKLRTRFPEDAVFYIGHGGHLVSYGRLGVAQKDGVFIVIEASDPDLVLSTAEALVSVAPR
jgi:glyoxylase-like metal-dependent hydrolase (beta-lactamase superfamily II)